MEISCLHFQNTINGKMKSSHKSIRFFPSEIIQLKGYVLTEKLSFVTMIVGT